MSVLDATVSLADAASLLELSEAEAAEHIRRGRLATAPWGAGQRVGWRSLARLLDSQLEGSPDRLALVLRQLQSIRAGSPGSTLGQLPDAATPAESARDRRWRLALLREAGRGADGGRGLSCAAFDAWAERNGVHLTAAALTGEFGGWNAAKREAGLAIRDPRPRRSISDAELGEHLRVAASGSAGGMLTMAEFNAYCKHGEVDADAALVASRLGSWNRAKKAAGLPTRKRGHQQEIGPTDPYPDPNRPAEA